MILQADQFNKYKLIMQMSGGAKMLIHCSVFKDLGSTRHCLGLELGIQR